MIDLKKLGYEKEKYGKTEQGIPARVTAVHRERYEVISAQGESFARCRASAFRPPLPRYPWPRHAWPVGKMALPGP